MNTAKKDDSYMNLILDFPLVPLRTEAQYDKAVQVMKKLAVNRKNLSTGEADYLSVLGKLIIEYEKRLPKLTPNMTPREALAYLMEINNLQQSDLVDCVGYKSNLSAFINGHRGLSTRAAMRLAEYFKVSPALFLPKE
jgi:Predicted transcription regulator containing HTH domain